MKLRRKRLIAAGIAAGVVILTAAGMHFFWPGQTPEAKAQPSELPTIGK